MGSEASCEDGQDPDEWFEESFWTVRHPANDIVVCAHSCRVKGTEPGAQYSLLVIMADPEICDNLRIKSSSLSIGCIYAEYARNYRLPLDYLVHHEVVRIADCLHCILSFVADIWPHRTGPQVALPEEMIQGRITLIGTEVVKPRIGESSNPLSRSTGFELHRDHSFVPTPTRRSSPVEELQEKPSPPSPLPSEPPRSTLSTFVKHFKEFVVAASPAEVSLDRLLQSVSTKAKKRYSNG